MNIEIVSPEGFTSCHANNLGTAIAVTDQTGNLLQDQLYPWGQQWTTAGSPQDLHFASLEQLEPDLGVNPTPHRRYTPTLGRWLTPDPGGVRAVDPADPQTWNVCLHAE